MPARRRQEEHWRPGAIPIEMQILADARNLGGRPHSANVSDGGEQVYGTWAVEVGTYVP
jgi:hypothetical protein